MKPFNPVEFTVSILVRDPSKITGEDVANWASLALLAMKRNRAIPNKAVWEYAQNVRDEWNWYLTMRGLRPWYRRWL